LIETAKTIEAGAIQIVEQLGSLSACFSARGDQFVKSTPMVVEESFVVPHFNPEAQPPLYLFVKINEMRIDVV
jgi:hypothetical protein